MLGRVHYATSLLTWVQDEQKVHLGEGWVALVPFVNKPYCSGALEGGCVVLLQNGRNLCFGVHMWKMHCTTSLLGETH